MIFTEKSLAKWEKENRSAAGKIKLPVAVKPATELTEPKFDRNAYQREYMRKRRAEAKS